MEKYKELEQKYKVKRKGLNIILEELKQQLKAKSMKIKGYYQSNTKSTGCSSKTNNGLPTAGWKGKQQ